MKHISSPPAAVLYPGRSALGSYFANASSSDMCEKPTASTSSRESFRQAIVVLNLPSVDP